MIDGFIYCTYFPQNPTLQLRALKTAKDESRTIRQSGGKRRSSIQEVEKQTPTAKGLEGTLTGLGGGIGGELV